MASNNINKHFQINKDLYDDFLSRSKDRFVTQKSALEYYLELGMRAESEKDNLQIILSDLRRCKNDLKYIKKLMEQYMANKGFPANKKINEDKCIIDFRKNIFRDSSYD